MIGERLRAMRAASGLSLRDLAQRVGVSHQAIHKYEINEDVPSSDVLIRLSRELGVKAEYFFRPSSVIRIVPAFRKHKRLPKRAQDKVIGCVSEALERRLELEQLASVKTDSSLPKKISGEESPNFTSWLEEAERAAVGLRSHWALGTAPIENLTEVLEDRGVRVEVVGDVDSNFDACGFWAEAHPQADDETSSVGRGLGSIPVIAVRLGVPGDRQRFSLAHELGHLVLDGAWNAVTADNDASEVSVEKAANRFAGAFLVPADAAIQELGPKRKDLSFGELLLLKRKYGFSIRAWIHRAADLGIISSDTKTRLFRRISAKGWRTVEPGEVPSETPTKSMQIALRAISEGMISIAKAAELLRVPVSDLLLEEAKAVE